MSAKLLHIDNNLVTPISDIEGRDDPRSFSHLSETHEVMKGDLKLPPHPSGFQDIGDVLVSDKVEVQSHTSLMLQDLKYLSSIIGKFDGENSRYPAFKYRFCTIADSRSLTDADKGLLLYMSLDNSVIDFVGKVTEEGHISYRRLWCELDSEFDPVHHGMLFHVSALFNIESMAPCDTLDNLVKLYKFVKLHYIALDRIDAGHEVEGFKMKILSRLCGDILDKVSS